MGSKVLHFLWFQTAWESMGNKGTPFFMSSDRIIRGSIEPTHGSVCSDVRKLPSMDVPKLQSTKADWNTKCPFHILAYIYSNLLNISTSYFIKILSYREMLDVDSQRIKKIHLSFEFQGWKSRKQRKVSLWNFEEWFHHDAIHINMAKDQNKSYWVGIEYLYIH